METTLIQGGRGGRGTLFWENCYNILSGIAVESCKLCFTFVLKILPRQGKNSHEIKEWKKNSTKNLLNQCKNIGVS